MYLRYFTFDNPKGWFKALAWAELWYNTTFHTSLGITPFKKLYGQDPPTLTHYNYSVVDHPTFEQHEQRDLLVSQLKHNLLKAEAMMKTLHATLRYPV